MNQQRLRILVTGATGFIGLALCKRLGGNDFVQRVLVRTSSDLSKLKDVAADSEIVEGDLLDLASLNSACENIDVVIHLAGIAHVNNVSEREYQQTIVSGSKNLIESSIRNNVKKFILLSSSLAQQAETGSESSTAYGRAKYDVETHLRNSCDQSSTDYLILRPANVYGPNMRGNIRSMIRWIKKGILPPLPEVDTRVSFIGINDLVELIRLCVEHPTIGNDCLLLAEKEPYKLLEIEKEIYRKLEKNIPTWRSPPMLLYAAAGLAGASARILGLVGINVPWSGISLRTYKNLVDNSIYSGEQVFEKLNYSTRDNLLDQLPVIIEKALEAGA